MKTKILKSDLGREFDKKIMAVKLSEVIAEVERNLRSKTDFIKKIDLKYQTAYASPKDNDDCQIVIISNEGQYFRLSDEDGVLKTKKSFSAPNSRLVDLKKF